MSSVNKINQVLNYDSVIGMSKLSSIDDSMMITGIKMSGFAKSNQNPNVTASSSQVQSSKQRMGDTRGMQTGYSMRKQDRSHRAESSEPYTE